MRDNCTCWVHAEACSNILATLHFSRAACAHGLTLILTRLRSTLPPTWNGSDLLQLVGHMLLRHDTLSVYSLSTLSHA
jgi:hypothetical protein